jgi:hypothetical protein
MKRITETYSGNLNRPGGGVDTLISTYNYEKGIYDRLERDFYGYGRVVQEQRDAGNAVYRAVTQDFHTESYYTKGLIKRELTSDGAGRPYLETENTDALKFVGAGEATDPASTHATLFPALVRTERASTRGRRTSARPCPTFTWRAPDATTQAVTDRLPSRPMVHPGAARC